MKVTTYHPLSGEHHIYDSDSILPVAAVADTILHHESLREAIEELQREGYKNARGRKILVGVGDLLAEVKKLREQIAALNAEQKHWRKGAALNIDESDESLQHLPGRDGPPLSEKPMDGISLRALARLLRDKNRKEKLTLREALQLADHLHKVEALEKALRRVYWGFDLESIDESFSRRYWGKSSSRTGMP